jgi:DNA invertase Pin-like site-specific DNA recombinase
MTEIVGYRRVSSTQQNLDRQDLPDVTGRIFEEKISAKSKDRPQLQEMLKYIRGTDEVQVHSIDRLARNLRDLEEIVNAITVKGASIRFIKEGLHFTPGVDDPFQKLMLQMLGSFAQFERSLMKARQQEGIEKAKAAGKFKGRGAVINEELVTDLLAYGVPAKDVCEWLGIGISSVYRIADKRGKNPHFHTDLNPSEIGHHLENVTSFLLVHSYNDAATVIAGFAEHQYFHGMSDSKMRAVQNLIDHVMDDPEWAGLMPKRCKERTRTAMELIYARKAPDGAVNAQRIGWLKYKGFKPEEVAEKTGVDLGVIQALWDTSQIKVPSWVEG